MEKGAAQWGAGGGSCRWQVSAPSESSEKTAMLELGGSSLGLKVGNSTKENICRHFSASPFTEGFLQALSLTLPGRYD